MFTGAPYDMSPAFFCAWQHLVAVSDSGRNRKGLFTKGGNSLYKVTFMNSVAKKKKEERKNDRAKDIFSVSFHLWTNNAALLVDSHDSQHIQAYK